MCVRVVYTGCVIFKACNTLRLVDYSPVGFGELGWHNFHHKFAGVGKIRIISDFEHNSDNIVAKPA